MNIKQWDKENGFFETETELLNHLEQVADKFILEDNDTNIGKLIVEGYKKVFTFCEEENEIVVYWYKPL